MEISKKDQKKLIEKYGYINEHHFEGDKTLEERIKEIDEEYERLLEAAPEFGTEYVNWLKGGWVTEGYHAMKEDLKKLYNK